MADDQLPGDALTYGWQADGTLITRYHEGTRLMGLAHYADFQVTDFRVRFVRGFSTYQFYDLSEPMRLWLMVNYVEKA